MTTFSIASQVLSTFFRGLVEHDFAVNGLVERIGWVLIHSVWQIAVVAIIASIAVSMMQRFSASARYHTLVAAMLLSTFLPIATWFVQYVDTHSSVRQITSDPFRREGDSQSSMIDDRDSVDRNAPNDIVEVQRIGDLANSNLTPASKSVAAGRSQAINKTKQSWIESARKIIRPWLIWIVVGWTVGVVLYAVRPLLSWWTIRRLRRVGVSCVSDDVRKLMCQASRRLVISRTVQLFQSSLIHVPVVFGYFRPVILLPIALVTSLPVTQLEAILAHELAHIRRYDFLVNLLQTLIETLFFYHPMMWWLSHRIRVEREHCCDDLVVSSVANRIEYGRALVAIAELRGQRSLLALAAADGSLRSRVRRIVGVTSSPTSPSVFDDRQTFVGLSIVCVFTVLLSSWAFAVVSGKPADDVTPTSWIARFDNGVEVELVGVRMHPGKDTPYWKPDGSLLPTQLNGNVGGSVMPNSPEQKKCREFAIEIRGLPKIHAVTADYEGMASTQGSKFDRGVWTGRHAAGPFADNQTAIRIGISTEPMTALCFIIPERMKMNMLVNRPDLKPFYERIKPLRVQVTDGHTELVLDSEAFGDLDSEVEWELSAADADGVSHQPTSQSASNSERAFRFDLQLSEIQGFLYRQRRYTDWATFENVSLQPGRSTAASVSSFSVRRPQQPQPQFHDQVKDPLWHDAKLLDDIQDQFAGLDEKENKPDRSSVEARILKELDQPISLSITDMKWREAVLQLGKEHQIPIAIDFKAISDLEIDQNLRVSLDFKDVKLSTVIQHLLAKVGEKSLGFVVEDDMLKVTAAKPIDSNSPKQAETKPGDLEFVVIAKSRMQQFAFEKRLVKVEGFDPTLLAVTALDPTTLQVDGRATGLTMMIVTDSDGVEYSAPIEVIDPDSPLAENQRDAIKLKPRKNPLRPLKLDPDKSVSLTVFKGQERRLQSDQQVSRVDHFENTIINVGTPDTKTLSVKGLAIGKTSMKVGLQKSAMDKFDTESTINVEVKLITRELLQNLFLADAQTAGPGSTNPNNKPKRVDPETILDDMAAGPLPQLWLMTGGIFFVPPQGPSAMHIAQWDNQHSNQEKFDPRVQSLIELGESSAPHVNKRLNALLLSDNMCPHLILVLRSIGNVESIATLIGILEKRPAQPGISQAPSSDLTILAATSALWKLTGRKHVFSPKQWRTWWDSVGPDFVPERDRLRLDVQSRVTRERVDRLVNDLFRNEAAAREHLVILGPAVLPHLLASFDAKAPDRFADSTPQPEKQAMFRLAWVIDELGGTAKLPQLLRRKYFTYRFIAIQDMISTFPIEDDAACRALIHCSFADFCRICLAVDPETGNQRMHSMAYWLSTNRDLVIRRLGSTVPSYGGRGVSGLPYWNQFVPARPADEEIAEAVPVMMEALKSAEPTVRNNGANLAEILGFCSSEKPGELIIALRDTWLTETDKVVRSSIGMAMARFGTPLVIQTFSDGLRSDRPEIVSEAAGLMDWIPIQRTEATQAAFDRLLELTHDESDRLRLRAVRTLRGKAPSMLATEFDRLVTDKVIDIRKECALALRSEPDPKYADILFTLVDDPDEQTRIEALSSIANLKHLPSMERLLPYLRDKKIHGWAVHALADMGGKDAIPLLIAELQSGNDVGGMIYQHLVRITHEKLEPKPEPWIEWWRKQRLLRADEKRKASDGQKDK